MKNYTKYLPYIFTSLLSNANESVLLQVNKWIREIQKVTKLDRDPSSGTALQGAGHTTRRSLYISPWLL
jgi:hypothetical protein